MRLIDADALEKEFCHGCRYENNKYVNCIDCAVANAPTVDAVEVVRCASCKWFDRMWPSGTIVPIRFKCRRKNIFVDTDDFCKYGEEKNDAIN